VDLIRGSGELEPQRLDIRLDAYISLILL